MQTISIGYGQVKIREWLDQLDLAPGERKLFECLTMAARGKDHAWPEQEWLARKVNVTVRTIRNYIRRMEKLQILRTMKVRINGSLRLVYYFLAHPVIVAGVGESDRKNFPVRAEKFSGHLIKRKKNKEIPPTPQRGNAAGAAKERENGQAQTQKGSAAEDGQSRTTGNLPRDNAALPDAVPGNAGGEQGSLLGLDRLSPSNRSLAGHGTDGVGRILPRVQPTGNPALSGNIGGDGFSQPGRTPDALSTRQAERRSRWFLSEIGRNLCRRGKGDSNAGQCDGIHLSGISIGSNVLRGASKGLGDAEFSSPEESERTVGTRRTGDVGNACLPVPSRTRTVSPCYQRGSEAEAGITQEKRFASCSSDKDGERQSIHIPTSAYGRTCGTTGLQQLGHRSLDGIFPADELNDVALATESPVWQAALALLCQQLPKSDADLWIRPIHVKSTSNGLQLDCPDRYTMRHVQDRYGNAIRSALQCAGVTDFFFSFGEQERALQKEKEEELRAVGVREEARWAEELSSMPLEEQFAVLVAAYPRKTSGNWFAWRTFRRLARRGELPEIGKLLRLLKTHKQSEDWIRDAGRWIPGLSKWLNNKPWWDVRCLTKNQKPANREDMREWSS